MRKRKWIQRVIKNKGSLTDWATKHRFIRNNRIQFDRAMSYAKRNSLTHRIRQINLAKKLKKAGASVTR